MSPQERDLNELVGELNTRLAEAIEQRDLAIAHDRQPYPTAWAHEQACKALEAQRARAEAAEAERDALRARLTGVAIHANRARNCIFPETPVWDALADLFAALEAPGGER